MILRHAFADDGASASSAVVDMRVGTSRRDEFLSQLESTWTLTAGGSAVLQGTQGRPGVAIQTVTAVGDAHRIVLASPSTAPILVGTGNGAITWRCAVMIPTLSDGVNNIVVRAGMGDSSAATDHVDGIYLEYDFATHGDHAWRLCCAANSARTKATSGIVPVAGTWQRLAIMLDADGTVASCTVDEVAGANTVSGNIPSGAGRFTQAAHLQAVKQLGAGALTCQWDYYDFQQELNR